MIRMPAHPIVIALVPVLSMYADSPGAYESSQLLIALGLAIGFSAALLLLAAGAYRNFANAALLVSALIVLFLLFDRGYAVIQDVTIGDVQIGRRRYVLPLAYAGVAAFAVWLARRKRPLPMITALLNVVALGAIIPPAFRIVMALPASEPAPPLAPITVTTTPARKPDIYYMVFDRYGDDETLRAKGQDNTDFYQYLDDRQFYRARQSRSNYIKTVHSLASSLNLTYLDDLVRAREDSINYSAMYAMLRQHRAGSFLRAQGYAYVHLGSWYWPMRDNPQASRNVNYYHRVPRGLLRLFDSGLFNPAQAAMPRPWLDQHRQAWYRLTRQVDDVIHLAKEPGPKFVLLHALIPHPPHTFKPDGTYLTRDEEQRRSNDVNYANSVDAANAMIRRMVDGILAESTSPPVIILQGDEGPYPPGTDHDAFDWRQASPTLLREKSGILNAYHLPGVPPNEMYPEISPVNSFRLVFARYFGAELPLLPDRTFRHASDMQPYLLDDITSVLRSSESFVSGNRVSNAF